MISRAMADGYARRWVATGAAWAGIGVALGAFGAHGLESHLAQTDRLAVWETAVRYQVWHALALVLLGLWCAHTGRRGTAPGVAFLVGSLCFSGSLYGLCAGVAGQYIGPVTPVGGLLLIVGWTLFAVSALRDKILPRNSGEAV